MREEDLLRELEKYLKNKQMKKDMFLIENAKYNTILKKEIYDIYDYKNDNNKETLDEKNSYLENYQSILNQSYTPEEIELARIHFMQDTSQVLTSSSPFFLREDADVIMASITRSINSIVYASNITDDIMKTAIHEAKRQGYFFQPDTPVFMLYDPELIKQSLDKDINCLNFIPHDAFTSELKSYVQELALKKNYVLSNNSPRFLKANVEVIKQTLRLDKNSGIYVLWEELTPSELINIERYVAENHLEFIINPQIPINFKRNTDICMESARNDSNSVNYFDWKYFHANPKELRRIINALIDQNYILNENSPDILRENISLCLNSIKNDIHSAKYFTKELWTLLIQDLENSTIKDRYSEKYRNGVYEIRHFLINHDFFTLEVISNLDSSLLKDDVLLDYYLKQLGISQDSENESMKIFYTRVKEFIKSIFYTSLNVSDIRKVFQMVAQKKWEDYRRENNDYYTNIFNRICDSLETNSNFIGALDELKFLLKVDDVLGNRKYDFFSAFIEYHRLYHGSKAENKVELLQEKRDEISKNAALFISKSKEDFASEQMALFDEKFKQYFTIRVDSPMVRKKVIEVKQRALLKKMFESHDARLMPKLDAIKNKYLAYSYNKSIKKDKIPQILDLFIQQSITQNVSGIDDVLPSSKPARFDEYENYERVAKIINRLNSHNIGFDSQDVRKYRDFITFDGEKYVYNGTNFSESELLQIMGYKDLKYVFKKMKSEIIQIAKSIDEFDNLSQDDIKSVIRECPFTDEYYQFNPSIYNRYFLKFINDKFIKVFDDNREIILNDNNYRQLMKLAHLSGLIHISTITELGYFDTKDDTINEIRKYVSDVEVKNIIASIPSLMGLLTPDEISIDHLDKIHDFKEMFKYADLKQISLLGKEVIKKIYSNNGFTSSSQAERIKVACDLVNAMVSRNKSTVPYINGSYRNYKYSMYDSTDETLLISGLDTNACFRCCGNDNDFLHYCALDKNGFVIKLTDSEGNFIGRASGFRNGNGVYINQLRTIYDKKSSAYSSEREAIIKTFEQACNDIVETSQNNSREENKIDFVVVTKSYTFDGKKPNVDNSTYSAISKNPMENESEDWKHFQATTKNLKEAARNNYFTTDFGNYSLICVKSAVGELTPDKIKKGDVPALYFRPRRQVAIDEPSDIIAARVNKIRANYSHQTKKDFKYIKLPQKCKVINGDNWYIVIGNQGIIDSCYLPNDEFAQQEFNTAMEQIMTSQKVVEDTHVPTTKK